LYLTIRAFHRAVNDVILSRRAIHAMNTLFPLATDQDLEQGDSTCIICREEMTAGSGAKKLPCNHIFHSNCLRSWFQRQQTCPTCRTDVLGGTRRPTVVPQAPVADAFQQPPPNMFPFMAQFAFPPPPPPAVGGNQQRNNAQDGADTAPTMPGTMPMMMPPFMPPHFFPPPPFLPPFPMPPNFVGLSDAELRAMESQERAAVEARVLCLSNISVLLDAAVLQLQQYTSIVAALSAETMTQSPNTSVDLSSVPTETTNVNVSDQPRPSTSDQPRPSSDQSRPSTSDQPRPSTSDQSRPSSDQLRPTTSTDGGDAAMDEVRQRRLQRFAVANDNA